MDPEKQGEWLKEMKLTNYVVGLHLGLARDHEKGPVPYDTLSSLYHALLDKNEVTYDGHYDWHSNEDVVKDSVSKKMVSSEATSHGGAMGASAELQATLEAYMCLSVENKIEDMVNMSHEKRVDLLYAMKTGVRGEEINILRETKGFTEEELSEITEAIAKRSHEALCANQQGAGHAVRKPTASGMLPLRVMLADGTFVTVAIRANDTVQRAVELVARKCDIKHYDTYALYAVPPRRARPLHGITERQAEHLPNDDNFVAAFADVEQIYANETDKIKDAQTTVEFVKRVKLHADAELSRYTPSYGYFAYVGAQKQILEGQFGIPARNMIGFLDTEKEIPWKVFLSHGDCVRLGSIMMLHETEGVVIESMQLEGKENRKQLRKYLPRKYIDDLEVAGEEVALDRLATELKEEYKRYGYSHKGTTLPELEQAYLERCAKYPHHGARFFWMKELMNRGCSKKDSNIRFETTIGIQAVIKENCWIAVSSAGLFLCQAETREMFCFFALSDVIMYNVEQTERGNLVLVVDATERIQGKGNQSQCGTSVRGCFKTQGAFQIKALLEQYKARTPAVQKQKEQQPEERVLIGGHPDELVKVEGEARRVFQSANQESWDEDMSESEGSEIEAALTGLKLAHASEQDGRAYFDTDTLEQEKINLAYSDRKGKATPSWYQTEGRKVPDHHKHHHHHAEEGEMSYSSASADSSDYDDDWGHYKGKLDGIDQAGPSEIGFEREHGTESTDDTTTDEEDVTEVSRRDSGKVRPPPGAALSKIPARKPKGIASRRGSDISNVSEALLHAPTSPVSPASRKEAEYKRRVKELELKKRAIQLKKMDTLKKEETKNIKQSLGVKENGFDKGYMLETNHQDIVRHETTCATGSQLVTDFDNWAMKDDEDDVVDDEDDSSLTLDTSMRDPSTSERKTKKKKKLLGAKPKNPEDLWPTTRKQSS